MNSATGVAPRGERVGCAGRGWGVPCHSEAAPANPEQREPQLLEVMAFEEKQAQSVSLSLSAFHGG